MSAYDRKKIRVSGFFEESASVTEHRRTVSYRKNFKFGHSLYRLAFRRLSNRVQYITVRIDLSTQF